MSMHCYVTWQSIVWPLTSQSETFFFLPKQKVILLLALITSIVGAKSPRSECSLNEHSFESNVARMYRPLSFNAVQSTSLGWVTLGWLPYGCTSQYMLMATTCNLKVKCVSINLQELDTFCETLKIQVLYQRWSMKGRSDNFCLLQNVRLFCCHKPLTINDHLTTRSDLID